MRRILSSIFGAVLVVAALQSCAGTYDDSEVGFAVDIRNAPAPPPIHWDRRPMLHEVGRSSVYVVDDPDYDVFMYGGVYYTYSSGYWYRADDDRSSFYAIDVGTVPRPVLRVPSRNWRHGYYDRRGRGDRSRWDRDRDRDQD